MKNTTKLLLPAILLAAIAAAALPFKRVHQPPEFCDQCVQARSVVDWQYAGRWTVHRTATVSATPVSELLAEHHACPAHEHRWSAPVHIAEAELETPNAPRVRSIGFLNEPRTTSFLRDVFAFADPANLAVWRDVAWQPLYASALESALRFSRFPENGFANRTEFAAWWDEKSYPLFNRLHEMTEAD